MKKHVFKHVAWFHPRLIMFKHVKKLLVQMQGPLATTHTSKHKQFASEEKKRERERDDSLKTAIADVLLLVVVNSLSHKLIPLRSHQ